jgi:hypothetical protein
LNCQAVWSITEQSASLAEAESGIRGMEMEQLMEQFTEKAWLIFKIAIFFLPALLGIWYSCSHVKKWWKMVKKE